MNKIIFFFIIIVFLSKTGTVFSKINIFDVDNIVVNNDNNQNIEILLDKAFLIGFQKLIEKILKDVDAKNISKTNLVDIKNLISSYQIIENNELTTKSKISINLSFNREKMNKFFYNKNISYAEIYKTDIVLFPLILEEDNYLIYSENYFFNNWNKKKKKFSNNFINYILPLESVEDIQFINQNKKNLSNLEIKKILAKYDVKDYIFLIISPDLKNLDIFLKGSLSGNSIIKNFKIPYIDDNNDSSFDNAIEEIKFEISELWKTQNLIDTSTPSFLNVILDINKKSDLLKLQQSLNKIELIENYQVLELNKDYAKLRIKYLGKINKIKLRFIQEGIKVFLDNSQWKLKLI